MFSFLGSRRRNAARTNAALVRVRAWSRQAWFDHWHLSKMADLQAELDAFLPAAMEHAQADPDLQGSYSAMITRFILLGIKDSGSHEDTEFEAALGVPMPTEAAT